MRGIDCRGVAWKNSKSETKRFPVRREPRQWPRNKEVSISCQATDDHEKISESPAPAAYARPPVSQGDGCAARNGIPSSRDQIPSPTFLGFLVLFLSSNRCYS